MSPHRIGSSPLEFLLADAAGAPRVVSQDVIPNRRLGFSLPASLPWAEQIADTVFSFADVMVGVDVLFVCVGRRKSLSAGTDLTHTFNGQSGLGYRRREDFGGWSRSRGWWRVRK